MPDDDVQDDKVVTEDPKPKDDKPALDPEALARAVSKQTAEQIAQVLAAQPPRTVEPAQGPVNDPLGDVIAPYVQAGTARSNLIAQLAADKADFYTAADADELAERLANKDEVERRAIALAQAGRPLPREDIYKHLKGEKFEEFAEKRTKRRAEREKRAQQEGLDSGGGSPRGHEPGMPSYASADQAYGLQDQGKLDEFLEGKGF